MTERIIPPFGGYIVYPEERENPFERLFGSHRRPHAEEPSSMTPLVDIYENDGAIIITTDMPGAVKDGIHLSMTGDVLTINAEVKRGEGEGEGGHWVKRERRVGTYVRTLHLSGEVDPKRITAEFKDGILTVTIAKPSKASTRAVDIPLG